jgi:hypothetical protein
LHSPKDDTMPITAIEGWLSHHENGRLSFNEVIDKSFELVMHRLDDAAVVLSTLPLSPMPKSRELALALGNLLRQAEERWLAGDTSGPMLSLLRMNGKASERKLRLFACACLRPSDDSPGRLRAIEAAEAYADSLISVEELKTASRFEVPYPTTSGFAWLITGTVPFNIDLAERLADGVAKAGDLLRLHLRQPVPPSHPQTFPAQ